MKNAAKAPNLHLPVGGLSGNIPKKFEKPIKRAINALKKMARMKNGVHITEKKIKQGGKVTVQYRGVIWQSGKMIWQSCEYYQKKPALINSMKTVVNHLNKFLQG
jgi:hypothetical protein